MKRIFIISLGWLLFSCLSDQDYTIPNYTCQEPALSGNKEITAIKKVTSKTPTQYQADDIIEGYVVSSDEEGNFYKSISIQNKDGTIGLTIPIDNTNLHLNYNTGRKVYLKMKNTYTDLNYDGLRVGSLYVYPGSRSATVGRLSLFDYPDIAVRSCEVIDEEELITITTLDNISDEKLNTLLKIENVQFMEESVGRHLYESSLDIGGATNHLIEDESGNHLIFRVSSYANFVEEKVPNGKGYVIGVLTKYQDDYQLMPRFYRDIQF